MISRKNDGIEIPIRRTSNSVNKVHTGVDTMHSGDESIEKKVLECEDNVAEWRDTALRLKADMENYRKRQQRWAHDEVQRERDRLLLEFVCVFDDMEKALLHLAPGSVTHKGVQIAFDNMQGLLDKQGVKRIKADNVPFDPSWHEAVAMIPGPDSQSEPLLITEVVKDGYMIDNRLLRPSQVVVSKRGM
jgi:molecular chaperone GrpE